MRVLVVCWSALRCAVLGTLTTTQPHSPDARLSPGGAQVPITGAVEVPVFVVDDDASPAGLIKQLTAFGMGGWWLGGAHYKPNTGFLQEVQTRIPKDTPVIVACQKGLR